MARRQKAIQGTRVTPWGDYESSVFDKIRILIAQELAASRRVRG